MKNRRSWAWLLVIPFGLPLALSGTTGCTRAGSASAANPKTDDERALYAWGLMLGRNASALAPSPAELELIKAGLTDSVQKNKPKVDIDKYGPMIDAVARKRANVRAEAEKGKTAGLIEAAAKEAGAVKLASGMVIMTTRPGTGAQPEAADRVKVHYEGRLSDGSVFDSSIKRGEPAVFPLGGVIKCWTEGVGHMKVGEKARLTCPSDLAYGDQGRPPVIPGGATLIFDVELLDVMKAEPTAAAMTVPAPASTPPVPKKGKK
ncbi:MAG TPA: FKBP-type peptidyl-prolyl cis-trans isomerase [Polyangia bacterium]|jgi:FKBP-type peptidyl-prolyl cis-trans isomerase FkpA|nr:FKBP-type peptidyl-prolyl cis-trans isomerase [Polyangia bacterium]